MSYFLQIGPTEVQPLATIRGWGDVCRWAEGLLTKEAGEIKHLCAYGWSQELEVLTEQLAACLKNTPPDDADTRTTLVSMIKNIEGRDEDSTVVTVTDGLGPE